MSGIMDDLFGPSQVPVTLANRVMKLQDAIKYAYLEHEIPNIRLVITQQEAMEYRGQLDRMYGFRPGTPQTTQPPIPIPGKYWAHVYGMEVWIKERES
jgi:hypothetical protein